MMRAWMLSRRQTENSKKLMKTKTKVNLKRKMSKILVS